MVQVCVVTLLAGCGSAWCQAVGLRMAQPSEARSGLTAACYSAVLGLLPGCCFVRSTAVRTEIRTYSSLHWQCSTLLGLPLPGVVQVCVITILAICGSAWVHAVGMCELQWSVRSTEACEAEVRTEPGPTATCTGGAG